MDDPLDVKEIHSGKYICKVKIGVSRVHPALLQQGPKRAVWGIFKTQVKVLGIVKCVDESGDEWVPV